MLKKVCRLTSCLLFLLALLVQDFVQAEDIARLQAGVVKITAKPPQGTANVGTGFIVRLDKEAVYIVTAAHVVAGDTHPKVEFFTKRNLPVTAEVLGLEGDDEVRGLALLVVKGSEILPKGLTALSLAGAARLTGGEDIMVIGFPRNAGPWAVVKGNISSRQGRDIYFSPSVDSGHSGGPIVQGGKVGGVVGAGDQSVGRGVIARSVQDYVEGFGITAQESTGSSSSSVSSAPVLPPPVAEAKPAPRQQMQGREITGRDAAPMVLIPAGEFWMGSPDGEGAKHEHPRHQIYLDAFYMDKFEVTVSRYAEFVRATDSAKPEDLDQADLSRHGNLPVVSVDWQSAKAYCEWAGKRLPTEAEWEKAARGTDGRIYPWGNEPPTAKLANFGYWDWKLFSNSYDKFLTAVNNYEAGKSPFGLHHMAGNAWEWTADWYDEQYYSKSPVRNPKGSSSGKYRVMRGGSWFGIPDEVRSSNRWWAAPTGRNGLIGFRCARDVPN
jgi:formylglycine-generating enzyme required for sulfatase activity